MNSDFQKVRNPMDEDDDQPTQQDAKKVVSQTVLPAPPSSTKIGLGKSVRIIDPKRAEQVAHTGIEQTFNSEFGKNTLIYDHIMEECEHLKFGSHWEDPDFPASQRSLSLQYFKMPKPTQDVWQQIVWKRPQEFLKGENIKLFDEIEPNDIKQGLLGGNINQINITTFKYCYFLCALSALAEQDLLIQRLFHTKEKSKFGVYSVWLNISGEWININVDDQIPFRGDKPAFSRGQGDELWVLLLEKAYAKAYGSYEIIEGGNPTYALRDLTGAPCENFDDKTPEEFWKYLEDNDNQVNVLTCYTKSTNVREEENDVGILAGHAYSILDHRSVRADDNKLHNILQIRNPWGLQIKYNKSQKEWTGDWSDKSKMWNPVLRQKLNVQDINDGTFWMSIQDFAKYFEGIGNCKVRDEYSYNSIKLNFQSSSIKLIQFKVKDQTHGFISVNQMDERMFHHSPQPYEYSSCRMFILKKEQKEQYAYIGGIYEVNRNSFIEKDFKPGDYVVITQFFWSQEIVRECTISSYSNKPISFEYLEGADPLDMLKLAFKYIAIDSEDKIDARTQKPLQKVGNYVREGSDWNYPLISKRYGFQYGSFYMYYKNGEISQVLHEELTLKMEGYMPLEPFFNAEDNKNGKYNAQFEIKISLIVPSDREAVILFDAQGSNKLSYNFSYRPHVYHSNTDEGKFHLNQVLQNPKQLLKVSQDKIVAKKNVSSFGRSQIIGQAVKQDTSRVPSQAVLLDQSFGYRPLQNEENTIQSIKEQDDEMYVPEIELEMLELFDDLLGNKITRWGSFFNWISFLMFPVFLFQAFAKNTFLDVMLVMSVINLINAEKLTPKLLRQIILGLYFSILVDTIFLFIDHEEHHILTGQSLTKGLYTFSIVFVYIGIVYKIFVAFSYLHVYKNFLSTMPYIQQGFRKIRYWLRDLQLDKETITRLKEQYGTKSVYIPPQNPTHKTSLDKSQEHISINISHHQ